MLLSPARTVYSPEMGALFERLRVRKGWTVRQSSLIGRRSGLKGLSHVMLWRLEQGQIKNPSRETVEAVAALYDVPYADLAAKVAAIIYNLPHKVISNTTSLDVLSPDTHSPSSSGESHASRDRESHVSIEALAEGLLTIITTATELLGPHAADALSRPARAVGGSRASAGPSRRRTHSRGASAQK